MHMFTLTYFIVFRRLYTDDPSLMYRINGSVTAHENQNQNQQEEKDEDRGFSTRGREESSEPSPVHWKHGRKAVLTGDVLTHTGRHRAGVFLDDYDYASKKEDRPKHVRYWNEESKAM